MSLLADFHFLRPAWLLLLVPALALAFLVARARRRSGSWQTVISPALLPYLLEDAAGPRRRGPLLPLPFPRPWWSVAYSVSLMPMLTITSLSFT